MEGEEGEEGAEAAGTVGEGVDTVEEVGGEDTLRGEGAGGDRDITVEEVPL